MNLQHPIENSAYYHIYNRGINGCTIFFNDANYKYFMKLYEKYIDPIADTYAWVLMGNHFHLLVRIKDEYEVKVTSVKPKKLYTYFSDLFNAYAQAINKTMGRTGSLFEHPFRRKIVTTDAYIQKLVCYIHHNPQKHGFIDNYKDYPWSSYGTILSSKPTQLKRECVIRWFDGIDNFIYSHEQRKDYDNEEWIIE